MERTLAQIWSKRDRKTHCGDSSSGERRATGLYKNAEFAAWVKEFREKYIVKGFLTPFYARGGRWGRVMDRVGKVNKFGDFILSSDMISKPFTKEGKDWIHNEELFFWQYLTLGQDYIS